MKTRRDAASTTTHARAVPRQLRIIGGRWRGRRWRFPLPGIRPTPDRVRETLFNWLQPRIVDARCLDLFAGSGALGLEALSRGAGAVVFIEQQSVAAASLRALLQEWQAQHAEVRCEDAMHFLRGAASPFDVVFLDPPFADGMLRGAMQALARGGWLAPHARIYVEHSRQDPMPPLPTHWSELRAGTAGEVGYHLLAYSPAQETLP